MTKKESIKLFEEKKVRTVWDDEQEKWYFSISDIVEVLTDSKDPKQYIKKMKSRDSELKSNWGTICTLVQMTNEELAQHVDRTFHDQHNQGQRPAELGREHAMCY